MLEYKKVGYLTSDFRMFHIVDENLRLINYHYHDYHKILILLKGDVTYYIEGHAYELKPNDIVLVNAGEVHKPVIHSDKPYERIIIYISPEFINKYTEDENDLSLCFRHALSEQSHVLRLPSFKNSRLGAITKDLDRSRDDKSYAHQLHHKLLFLEFLLQLNRATIQNKIKFIETTASSKKILSILDYINQHLTEDLSIDDLSDRFFLSRYYLMHSFKEQTGYTIGEYISKRRLNLARELISAGEPITTACYECGFKNYSTFSRAYKKYFGEAPRKQKAGNN